MVEILEQNPNVWQRLFPSEGRSELVREYVGKVAKLPTVKKVMAISIGTPEHKQQRLLVIFSGTESLKPSELREVNNCFTEVCADTHTRNNFGIIPAVTNELFENDLKNLDGLKNMGKTILWEKSAKF